MPRGFGTYAEDVANEPERPEIVPRNYLFFPPRIGKGQGAAPGTYVVRFLVKSDDDIAWAWCNQVAIPGVAFPRWVVSADQSGRDGFNCPLQMAGAKRSRRGWINLIWRDAPAYKKKPDGFFEKDQYGNTIQVGEKDQLALWSNISDTVIKDLSYWHVKASGLGSRDFEVKISGLGKEVEYDITPADLDGGAKPISDADRELSQVVPDLNEFITPGPWEKLQALVNGGGANPNGNAYEQAPVQGDNPFTTRRR